MLCQIWKKLNRQDQQENGGHLLTQYNFMIIWTTIWSVLIFFYYIFYMPLSVHSVMPVNSAAPSCRTRAIPPSVSRAR